MIQLSDQLGRPVTLASPARRIVSLVPSQTELLADLGLAEEVVGITRFCVHPRTWYKTKTRVGGTKDFRVAQILALQPDLILANKEENTPEGIGALALRVPVWVSDIRTITEATDMIRAVGLLTGRAQRADEMAREIVLRFGALAPMPRRRAVYLIWRDPYMAAGSDTFIHHLMAQAGLDNAVQEARYPILRPEDLQRIAPACILLSSEPYPFKTKHLAELAALCPQASVRLVDGEMFSWYGSRLLQVPDYLRSLG